MDPAANTTTGLSIPEIIISEPIDGPIKGDDDNFTSSSLCEEEEDETFFEYEERFKVDRRKLEKMILQTLENVDVTAEDFFGEIEQKTSTRVFWPSRLKIGAKSKKDPHIRVGGCEAGVREAKARIIEYLDSSTSRVTMKMDVSYTDHSHVIGKSGNTIRRVMAETACHIHFPDSNRSNPCEKSNQVSIAGEVEGAERARARVRELTPLVFIFDVPIIPSHLEALDPLDPYLKTIQDQYNIQVMFRQKQKTFLTTTVFVKGCEWECSRVKEATLLLIDHFTSILPPNTVITVSMNMEISPQHHLIVLGKGNVCLKGIMKRTNTTILFPDATDPNIPPIRKGSVTILGAIHNVYLARQQLLGSLPLVLMFDLPENHILDEELIHTIQEENNVSISIKPKLRQGTKAVVLKVQERNATGIYIARARLLGLPDPNYFHAVIPETYKIPPGPVGARRPHGLDVHYNPFSYRSFRRSHHDTLINFQLNKAHEAPGVQWTGSPPMGTIPQGVVNTATASFKGPFPTTNEGQPIDRSLVPNHPMLHEYAIRVLKNISRLQKTDEHGRTDGHDTLIGCEEIIETSLLDPPCNTPPHENDDDSQKGRGEEENKSSEEREEEKEELREEEEEDDNMELTCMENFPSSDNDDEVYETSEHADEILRYSSSESSSSIDCASEDELLQDEDEISSSSTYSNSSEEVVSGSDVSQDEDISSSSCSSSSESSVTSLDQEEEGMPEEDDHLPRSTITPGSGCEMRFAHSDDGSGSSWTLNLGFRATGDTMAEAAAAALPFVAAAEKILGKTKNEKEITDGKSVYLDNLAPTATNTTSLSYLLSNEGLDKYIRLFSDNDIDLPTFLTLTEADLKEMDISSFGGRRRLLGLKAKIHTMLA